MNPSYSLDFKIKTFLQDFREIRGIKFTFREIDIAACIMHNRGEKKIAELLFIAPKTVNAHIFNIMHKLRCNSREYIIDFFERSGKLQLLRHYYTNILIENDFKKRLIKIGSQFNLQPVTYIFNLMENSSEYEGFFDRLKKDLKLANIHICVNRYSPDNFSQEWEIIKQEGYWNWALQFINKLIDKAETEIIVKEFKTLSSSLCNMEKPAQDLYLQPLNELSNIKFFSIAIVTILTFISCGCLLFKNNAQSLSNHTESVLAIQENINETLPKLFEDLSANSLTRDQADKNYLIVKQFDQIVQQILSGQIQTYFNGNELASDKLINSVYNLNMIASYSIFIEHNAEKAEKILKYVSILVENYLLDRSKLKINFGKLSVEETYTELCTINDLPEMYALTNYLLGRCYIYQKAYILAGKHFELSKFLAHKTGLFEEILSVRSGIGIIMGDQTDISINEGDYIHAQKALKECINFYEKIRENNKEYKINYKPNNRNPATIIPKKDIYNTFECNKRIIKLYKRLIVITDDKNQKYNYLATVLNLIIGDSKSPGMLKIITALNYKLRIAADSYNTLGNFLLILYDEDMDFSRFKNNIIQRLNLTKGKDLDVIYQIFDLAKSLSRNTEFSKADAYDGLAKVCERLINQSNIAQEDKKMLEVKVLEFEEARNTINRELKRDMEINS